MKHILSALMIGVMSVVGGIAGKAGLKYVAPTLVKKAAQTGAKEATRQGAKTTGKVATSKQAGKAGAAAVTAGGAGAAATQVHDPDDSGDLIGEAEAHEPPQHSAVPDDNEGKTRYRRRDLADTSGL